MTTDRESQAVALLPCPFCGGRAELTYSFNQPFGKCTNCSTVGPLGSIYKEGAIELWNRRFLAAPVERSTAESVA